MKTHLASRFYSFQSAARTFAIAVMVAALPAIGIQRVNGGILAGAEIGVILDSVAQVDDSSTVNFGMVNQGTNSSKTFVITNSGGAELTGISVSIEGSDADRFSVTVSPATSVVSSGTTEFTVVFTPGEAGMKTTNLIITSNDADESPFNIQLFATSVAVQPSGPPPTADAITLANGPSTLAPLANDADPNVTISRVTGAGVTVSADGRRISIPAGLFAGITYTTSANWTSTVSAMPGTPIATPAKWQGLLRDANGVVVGQFSAKVTKGKYTAAISIGHVRKAAKFVPGTPATTAHGQLLATLDSNNHLQVTVGTNTVDARPLFATATTRKYVAAFAAIDPLLLGGGYGNVAVKKTGATTFAGVLPDGTRFSAGSGLADNFTVPIYAPIKGTKPKGTVAGQLTFAAISETDVTGELSWVKPAQTKGLLVSGVNTIVTINGAILAPNFGPTGNISGTFSGGNFQTPANMFTPLTVGKAVPTALLKKLTISGRTGGVSGLVFDPVTNKPIPFKGVYIPKSQRVMGFLKSATTPGQFKGFVTPGM